MIARAVAWLRLLGVPAWTLLCYGGWLLAPALGSGARPRVVRGWARGLLRLLRIRVEWSGPRPEAPFLLVANHLGYLDVPVLASGLDVVFVAKRDVRDWPLFGPLARAIGTIFVDRTAARDALRVERLMRDALEGGRNVVLFAEGTSSDGSRVLPLRTALLDWAAREQRAVATATLTYLTHPFDPPAGRSLCWWGDMTFLPHLRQVCRLQPSLARVALAGPVTAPDRRSLADRLHRTLTTNLVPSGHVH